MKFKQFERFGFPTSSCTTYIYTKDVSSYGDILFIGSDNGNVAYYSLPLLGSSKSMRFEYLSNSNNQHRGAVECMMYQRKIININKRVKEYNLGYLFTGGRDHSIRIWDPTNTSNILIQTLTGHNGVITGIADGFNGNIISISSDGIIKMWIDISTNNLPSYECIQTITYNRDIWLSSIIISHENSWAVYIGDSTGSIDVYRKAKDNSTSNNIINNILEYNKQIYKHSTWKDIHQFTITKMLIVEDEEILISVSNDCTCRISDSKLGTCLYTISNRNSVRYTGIAYIPIDKQVLLIDELGNLEISSISQAEVIKYMNVIEPNDRQRVSIYTSHKNVLMIDVNNYRNENEFLILLPRQLDLSNNSNKSTNITINNATIKSALKSTNTSGVIALYRLSIDQSFYTFCGHNQSILLINSYNSFNIQSYMTSNNKSDQSILSNHASNKQLATFSKHKTILGQNSKEEMYMISLSNDMTIRGWDEYDYQQLFQHTIKSNNHEIISCKLLYDLNTIATGHENGIVYLWNIDSGIKVEARGLTGTVHGLVEGRNAHSRGLIGADSSGKLIFWNLTLFEINPSKITSDLIMDSFHDHDLKGILSIGFHLSSNTIFSGGYDCTIRYWNIASEKYHTLKRHSDGICCIEVSSDFVLSGDESGDLILWRIKSDSHTMNITEVVAMCRWPSHEFGGYRQQCQLIQISHKRIYILLGGLMNQISIYEVQLERRYIHAGKHRRRVDPVHIHELLSNYIFDEEKEVSDDSSDSDSSYNDSDNDVPSLNSRSVSRPVSRPKSEASKSVSKSNLKSIYVSNVPTPKNNTISTNEYELYASNHVDLLMTVIKLTDIVIDTHEISNYQMTCYKRPNSKNIIPHYLYIGLMNGDIRRYDMSYYIDI